MSKKIDKFTGVYYFLSNFYRTQVTYEGVAYPTSEHAFQAQKTFDPEEKREITETYPPGVARRLGRKCTLRSDWEDVKLGIMKRVLQAKFRNTILRDKLLATGDARLEEANSWKDAYWGVYNGQGENHLGRLLMEVRDELAAQQQQQFVALQQKALARRGDDDLVD